MAIAEFCRVLDSFTFDRDGPIGCLIVAPQLRVVRRGAVDSQIGCMRYFSVPLCLRGERAAPVCRRVSVGKYKVCSSPGDFSGTLSLKWK
jgi:hypothetical protein